MVKGDRDIIDRRLEETLDLFQPTARQEQIAADVEQKAERSKTPKSRRWDRENRAFAFRILPEDDERIAEWASRLGATRDEVARGLVGAALEALDAGQLALVFERETQIRKVPVRTPTGKETTRRVPTTETTVTWNWKAKGKS